MTEPHALSLDFVAQALGAKAPPSPQRIGRVTGDSRALRPGDLFVALRGERFDGHDFIPRALAQGAAGVISEKAVADKGEAVIFEVSDSLAAYRALAAAWRRRLGLPVLAIAGSVGKTTTKEMLAALLRGRYTQLVATQASENGFVGIPKTLLELRAESEVAVVEIGIDAPEAMAAHLELVLPDALVVTAVGAEHLEGFGSIAKAAEEECLALHWMHARGGLAAINLDDPYLAPFATLGGGRPWVGYSLRSHLRPAADRIRGEYDEVGETLKLWGAGFAGECFSCPLPGRHNARNLLGALALARAWGLEAEELERGLSSFVPPPGRSHRLRLPSGVEVLYDAYNANPDSVQAALRLVWSWQQRSPGRRSFICLGDMAELGTRERYFHERLARPLRVLKPAALWLYGRKMRFLFEGLRQENAGFDLQYFESKSEMGRALHAQARPGDLILIKGSRSTGMEDVFDALRSSADPSPRSE